MGNTRPSEFEKKLTEHLSTIQKKPKAKMSQEHPLSHAWPNPIEWIFQVILEYTIKGHGITHQELVNKTMWDTKTVRNYVKSLMDQGRILRVNMKYVAPVDNMKAGQLRDAASWMTFDR